MEPNLILEWLWIALAVAFVLLGIVVAYIDQTYISREIFDQNFKKVERNEDIIIEQINKINKQLGNKDMLTRKYRR